jgi:hypothetical protein
MKIKCIRFNVELNSQEVNKPKRAGRFAWNSFGKCVDWRRIELRYDSIVGPPEKKYRGLPNGRALMKTSARSEGRASYCATSFLNLSYEQAVNYNKLQSWKNKLVSSFIPSFLTFFFFKVSGSGISPRLSWGELIAKIGVFIVVGNDITSLGQLLHMRRHIINLILIQNKI